MCSKGIGVVHVAEAGFSAAVRIALQEQNKESKREYRRLISRKNQQQWYAKIETFSV